VKQPTTRRRWLAFAGLALGVLVVDQLSKIYVDATFGLASPYAPPGALAPTPVLDSFVRIAKSYNDGGIFGLFGSSAPVLALASLVVMALLVYYQHREGGHSHWLLTVALGLLLGGALGNFADRARIGHVIDWVDMGIGDMRWYTFNVADAAISGAISLFIVLAIFGGRLAGTQPADEAQPATAAEAPR
jgi:signal peptidase II